MKISLFSYFGMTHTQIFQTQIAGFSLKTLFIFKIDKNKNQIKSNQIKNSTILQNTVCQKQSHVKK